MMTTMMSRHRPRRHPTASFSSRYNSLLFFSWSETTLTTKTQQSSFSSLVFLSASDETTIAPYLLLLLPKTTKRVPMSSSSRVGDCCDVVFLDVLGLLHSSKKTSSSSSSSSSSSGHTKEKDVYYKSRKTNFARATPTVRSPSFLSATPSSSSRCLSTAFFSKERPHGKQKTIDICVWFVWGSHTKGGRYSDDGLFFFALLYVFGV